MPAFICVTCGTQYAATDHEPAECPICLDERQFLPPGGQQWTTLEQMRGPYFNAWRRHEPKLYGIGTIPNFAIGQRALLVQTPHGNVMWDCITLIDDATIDLVHALGGIAAIAISHPHYYSCMVEWAHAFDAPVWLHEADRAHVMRPDPLLHFWSGATATQIGYRASSSKRRPRSCLAVGRTNRATSSLPARNPASISPVVRSCNATRTPGNSF